MNALERIVSGVCTGETITFPDGSTHIFKDLADHIFCADGTEVSVQASHTHYCTPRDDIGPYRAVEVGYPTADPPESWRTYADGDYPSSVYGYVPVALVREFIKSHEGLAAEEA